MNNPSPIRIPWSGRGMVYDEGDIAAVVEAMKNADPQTQGRYQAEFEAAFCAYSGSPHAFALSSATAALELAALASRLGPGDEVVIPAHTFAASAIPFARTGAKLVWADIDPDTRGVTAATIAACLTPATKLVVVVHLYGLVCDMDPIMELAARHGVLVVEDAAQCIGARYKGHQTGSIGDFGCYSFHTHKNMTTLGEGGILTVKSPAHAALIPGLRHNGMRGYQGERPHYWIPAMSDVDFDVDGLWPYNFCIGEVQCALGTRLLGRIDAMNAERKARAERFIAAFADYPELAFQKAPPGCEHAWHLMAVRYDGASRDDFMACLSYSLGVRVVVQYNPLYRYPMFIKAGFGEAHCPETDRFFDRMVSFPFQHWMPDEQFETMIALVRQGLDLCRKGTS